MGTLLLKLYQQADESRGGDNTRAQYDYYFRETTAGRTIQVHVEVILGVEGAPAWANCLHLSNQGIWFRTFNRVTPASTDKFTWTGNDEMSAADALAESIAKSAFALLR